MPSHPMRKREQPFTTKIMTYQIRKIIGLIFISVSLLGGILSIYRATLKTSQLTIINGKVIDKKIEYSTSLKGGRDYYLAFHLSNRQDKIAINLGTKRQAEKTSLSI